MSALGIRNFNDVLALLLMVFVVPGIWVAIGLGCLEVPDVIVGATIPVWTLIAQYYFRKARGSASTNGGE